MLTAKITNFLNSGDAAVADIDGYAGSCFVRIRPLPKPGVPREERRYLNSTWSMWEYWDFEFRRIVLRDGWQSDEWNYDRYIETDQILTTHDEPGFMAAVQQWVPSPSSFKHTLDSHCPL